MGNSFTATHIAVNGIKETSETTIINDGTFLHRSVMLMLLLLLETVDKNLEVSIVRNKTSRAQHSKCYQ